MKANQALDECAQIECHLRNLLSEVELEEAGATITPGRPLHFRVMRVIGHLKDRLAEFSAPEGRPEPAPKFVCRYRGKGDPPQDCDYQMCGCAESPWEPSAPVTPEPPQLAERLKQVVPGNTLVQCPRCRSFGEASGTLKFTCNECSYYPITVAAHEVSYTKKGQSSDQQPMVLATGASSTRISEEQATAAPVTPEPPPPTTARLKCGCGPTVCLGADMVGPAYYCWKRPASEARPTTAPSAPEGRTLKELDNVAAFLRAVEWDNHGTEIEAHDHAHVLELISRELESGAR